jgi:exopolysaccharide biosynthesis polyprenyl glycosylphosphotransferase
MIVAGEAFADLITISFAVMLSCYFYQSSSVRPEYPARLVCAGATLFALVMVAMLDRAGAYRRGNSLLRVRETEQVLRVSAQALLVSVALSFLSGALFSQGLLSLCIGVVPLLLFVQKNFTYSLIHTLHARGVGNEKVLIYGAGCTGRRVFSALRGSPKLGLEPVAVVDDDPNKVGSALFEMAYERRHSVPITKGPITKELIVASGADLAIIAIPSIGRDKFMSTVDEVLTANARVSFVPSHLLSSDSWLDYRDIDGILLATLARPARRLAYETAKRICDFAISAALMVIGLPLFLSLAILIRLDSQGPVLFQQERVGQDGKRFRMYKFRSMKTTAWPYDYSPRASIDPRITRIGRFLRKTSLDELPQLLNVLEGSMSLVGPRPEMPFIVEQYTDRHRLRLQVKPGITGLWQLSGDRAFLIHENIEYDLYYIQHRNFFMDVAILLHTSVFAMRGV